MGFETDQAPNADEALSILSVDENIEAIFSDVEMPGNMDGPKLMEMVWKRWPDVSILVASGRDAPVDSLRHGERFFSKSYAHETVAQTVREMVLAARVCRA